VDETGMKKKFNNVIAYNKKLSENTKYLTYIIDRFY